MPPKESWQAIPIMKLETWTDAVSLETDNKQCAYYLSGPQERDVPAVDAGENLVRESDRGLISRYKAPDVSQEDNEPHLFQIH